MASEHSRTDASLVRTADPSAFSELYARHVDTVYRWFRRRIDWATLALDANRGLLSLAAQHPDARVDRDPAAYRAAEERLFPKG